MFKGSWKGDWSGIKPKGDAHKPSRNVVKHTGTIMRVKYASRKNGRMMKGEGLLERDAMYLFETSSNITRYREQPFQLQYPDGNRMRRYTPDFELELTTGETVIVEIKHHESLKNQEIQHKYDCVDLYFKKIKQPYLMLTDESIRRQPRLSNLNLLATDLPRIWPTEAALNNVYQQHEHEFPMSFQEAKTLFNTHQMSISSFIVAGFITLNLDEVVHSETVIYPTKEKCHDSFWISKEYGF